MNDDSTLTNLKTVRNYLKSLSKQGKITTERKKQIHSKTVMLVMDIVCLNHTCFSLKYYPFWPTVDASNTPH